MSKTNIYVEAEESSWIVTRLNHRILVSGDYMKPEAIEAVNRVVDEGISSGKQGFVIYYPKNAVEKEIGRHIKGVKPYPNQRNYYRLDLEEFDFYIEPRARSYGGIAERKSFY